MDDLDDLETLSPAVARGRLFSTWVPPGGKARNAGRRRSTKRQGIMGPVADRPWLAGPPRSPCCGISIEASDADGWWTCWGSEAAGHFPLSFVP